MNELRLRSEKNNVTGRSLLLNTLAILINIAAVVLIVKGFHPSTYENVLVYKYLGFGLLAVSLAALFFLKGLFLFSYVSRVLVGGLFIVSGLVKANDPWGFAFKLEEYFAPNGLSFDYPFFESFEPFILELSILVCVAEIVLGVAVVLGGKIKLTSWLLVILMLFFAWLTYYTFSCVEMSTFLGELDATTLTPEQIVQSNRQCVTDCGCFGDALKGSVGRSLEPIESFWKDLVLLYFGLVIFFNQWRIKLNTVKENWILIPASILVIIFFSWVFGWYFPIFFAIIAFLGAIIFGNAKLGRLGKPWKMAIFVTLVTLLFSAYTTSYLPVKDYRAYAIGNDLHEQMNNGVAEIVEFEYYYKNKETGNIDTFNVNDWKIYGNTDLYEYHDRRDFVQQAGKLASITDFSAVINYNALTEEEKASPIVDSMIQAEYYAYYQEQIVLTYEGGADTIALMDYDTLYYPDSIYTKGNQFVGLMDKNDPFLIDLTSYLLDLDHVLLMTIRDISAINEASIADFKELAAAAAENGIPFYVLSPAGKVEINEFKTTYDFDPTFLQIDGVEVKIIVRSNPGLIYLEKGIVKDKWPSRSVPDFNQIDIQQKEPK
jgi:uncharacterized membrane protein YphA (DoxX/SURF4 family)